MAIQTTGDRARPPAYGLPRSLRSLAMTGKGGRKNTSNRARPRGRGGQRKRRPTRGCRLLCPSSTACSGLKQDTNNAWRFRCTRASQRSAASQSSSGSVAAYQRGRRTASAAAHPFATGPDLIPGRPAPAACGLEGQAPRPTGSSRPRDRRKAGEQYGNIFIESRKLFIYPSCRGPATTISSWHASRGAS